MSPDSKALLKLGVTIAHQSAEIPATEYVQSDDLLSIVERAEQFEIAPVVLHNVLKQRLSERDRSIIKSKELSWRARAYSDVMVLVKLSELLHGKNISFIAVKGPALAKSVYGDPSLRVSRDLDVLIHPRHLKNGIEALKGEGFKATYSEHDESAYIKNGYGLGFVGRGKKIDVHGSLLESHLSLDLDSQIDWEALKQIEVGNATMRVLSPALQFIFLCAHGAKHEWSQLRLVCDIGQAIQSLTEKDVTEITEVSRKIGAQRLVALGVRVAEHFLQMPARSFGALSKKQSVAVEKLLQHVLGEFQVEELARRENRNPFLRNRPNLRRVLFWSRCRERLVDRFSGFSRLVLLRLTTRHPLRIVA